MRVVAKQGRLCPRQDPRDPPINDREPVDVPETTYYRRRIVDGSLIYAVHAKDASSNELLAAVGKKTSEGAKK
jgi:hypothetical protein